jgi:hypothetical protein
MGVRYFGRHFAWLTYSTCQSVPVLALSCKQRILSKSEMCVSHCLNVMSDLFI